MTEFIQQSGSPAPSTNDESFCNLTEELPDIPTARLPECLAVSQTLPDVPQLAHVISFVQAQKIQ